MKVVAVLNQKGGVGKTTLSLHLAVGLTQKKQRVLFVDADPQGSALEWSEHRDQTGKEAFPVIGLAKRTLWQDIPLISKGYDWVIIDGPPRVADITRGAIVASHLILVPLRPSPYDLWAIRELMEILEEVKVSKKKLSCAFVINGKEESTAVFQATRKALKEFPYPTLKTTIGKRVAFAESAAHGKTVLETEPKGQAAREIQSLVKEIMEWKS